MMDSVYTIDWVRMKPEVFKALQAGLAEIKDGVIYQDGRIIQHLPLKLGEFKDMSQALSAVQATTVAATAVGTFVVVGAIIVQTAYLSRKIEAVRQAVNLVAQDVTAQNEIYYIDKASDYLAGVDTARHLLASGIPAEEIADVAAPLLASQATGRNKILALMDGIMNFSRQGGMTPQHFKSTLTFVHALLDVVPKGIHVEYLLANHVGKSSYAAAALEHGGQAYFKALETYREVMNELHRDLVLGRLGEREEAFRAVEDDVEALLGSDENRVALSLPADMGKLKVPLIRMAEPVAA